MSTPQTESPTPAAAKKSGKKDAALKAPLSEFSQQLALNNAERAARESLSDAQAALGRQRRLEKAARKDPAVADILDQNKASAAVIEQLRAELATVAAARDSAIADVAKNVAELVKTKADLELAREQLLAALKPKAE